MQKEFITNNLDDTSTLALKFVNALDKKKGCFVSLIGDIGSGKTAFVKLVAKYLGIKETVTSPSFVILNEYFAENLHICHFDLYRLEETGIKTIVEELREYSKPNYLTFVEWSEFSQGEIPLNHLEIKIEYISATQRKFIFIPSSDETLKLVEDMRL